MGRLVSCAPRDDRETEVLAALLAGARVYVLREGLEYRQYRASAPLGMYRRLVALEREMREMGIVVVRNGRGKSVGNKEVTPSGGADIPDRAVRRKPGDVNLR